MSTITTLLGLPPRRRDLMGRLGAVSLEAAGYQQDAAAAMRAAAATDAELRAATADLEAERDRAALLEMQLGELRAELEVDPATKLYNKRWLVDRWSSLQSRPTGLLLLDLDGFKRVNDRWGHDTGDEVIRTVGDRLAAHSGCWPVRLTRGDEFAVVLTDGQEPLPAAAWFGGLVAAPMTIADVEEQLVVTASIGVTTVADSDAVADVLHRADVAMYNAKRSAGHLVLWEPGMTMSAAMAGSKRASGGVR